MMRDCDDDLYDVVIPAVVRLVRDNRQRVSFGPHKGSVKGRRFVGRDHKAGHDAIYRDNFTPTSTYSDEVFQTRFRLTRQLFSTILQRFQVEGLLCQKRDATGRAGLSTIQKMTAALRMQAYSLPADAPEYVHISASSGLVVLKEFCSAIVQCFGPVYLRRSTTTDLQRIYRSNSELGFPGLLGSIDYTHFGWTGCPKALHGQYRGKEGKPTVILEAVATHDLWIWNSYFGAAGTLNDINVLDQSDVLDSRGTPRPAGSPPTEPMNFGSARRISQHSRCRNSWPSTLANSVMVASRTSSSFVPLTRVRVARLW